MILVVAVVACRSAGILQCSETRGYITRADQMLDLAIHPLKGEEGGEAEDEPQ